MLKSLAMLEVGMWGEPCGVCGCCKLGSFRPLIADSVLPLMVRTLHSYGENLSERIKKGKKKKKILRPKKASEETSRCFFERRLKSMRLFIRLKKDISDVLQIFQ